MAHTELKPRHHTPPPPMLLPPARPADPEEPAGFQRRSEYGGCNGGCGVIDSLGLPIGRILHKRAILSLMMRDCAYHSQQPR